MNPCFAKVFDYRSMGEARVLHNMATCGIWSKAQKHCLQCKHATISGIGDENYVELETRPITESATSDRRQSLMQCAAGVLDGRNHT